MWILYFILWVIFNGKLTLEIALFGVLIASLVFLFTCKFTDYTIRKELHTYKKMYLMIKYIFLLCFEIIKANLAVAHFILTQKEEVEPVLVEFEGKLETPTGKAFLANAITLTPGTITVSLEENTYMVHCLDNSMADGLDNSTFEAYLKKIEED